MIINLSDSKARKAQREAYLHEWHKFFAIIPRRVGKNRIAFLQFIERRGEKYKGMCYPPEMHPHPCWKWRWEFRLLGEDNENRD